MGTYDLVVIDESHNFRNGVGTHANTTENRYVKLMEKVIRAGVKTKVLMISATPVNNRFVDLRNQLAIAYEGDSKQIDSKLGTKNPLMIFSVRRKKHTMPGVNLTRKIAQRMHFFGPWTLTF